MSSWIDWGALGKILLGSVICGALLPAVFAVGLRALHIGAPSAAVEGDASSQRLVGGNPVGIAIAVLCFAAVLAAIGWGIDLIVQSS